MANWFKPSLSNSKLYPGGFTMETEAMGSAYAKPASATSPLLSFSEGVLDVSGGNYGTENTFNVTLQGSKGFSADNSVKLGFASANGLLRGTIPDPTTGKSLKISWVAFQKQNMAAGHGAGYHPERFGGFERPGSLRLGLVHVLLYSGRDAFIVLPVAARGVGAIACGPFRSFPLPMFDVAVRKREISALAVSVCRHVPPCAEAAIKLRRDSKLRVNQRLLMFIHEHQARTGIWIPNLR